MTSEPRFFTRAEDELIVKQSKGEFGIKELRRLLRANVTTIKRRAEQLGVQINFNVARPPAARSARAFVNTLDNLTPARITDDKLLKRLRLVHGEP